MSIKPEVLIISTYPPRECGIATYTYDLTQALQEQFSASLSPRICAIESTFSRHQYDDVVKYTIQTDAADSYVHLARKIDLDDAIEVVVLQHEFGLFARQEEAFFQLLSSITKPLIVVFHTVLPHPDPALKLKIKIIARYATTLVVMTHTSVDILHQDYQIDRKQIDVIPHGTHLVDFPDKDYLKRKYGLKDKLILSTFGLLSQGKNVEMTLQAMPAIIKEHPEVVFLVLGKTHPDVFKEEEDKYCQDLKVLAEQLHLQYNVRFISHYLPTAELLDYLQLTDVYLFTSKDPNQAVSGTFAYALSCGCPIVSTPIPHAREVLADGAGVIVDFNDYRQMALEVNLLLSNEGLRQSMSINAIQKMAATAWQNSAIAHAQIFLSHCRPQETLIYSLPDLNYTHLERMTDEFGLVQFSQLNQADIHSGYTLDDNARALIAMCMEYEIRPMTAKLKAIVKYLNFLKFCYTESGVMLNYINQNKVFTEQNKNENLEDANGRAIWALGYLIGISECLPEALLIEAKKLFGYSMQHAQKMHSTRAMAFTMKGLYYKNLIDPMVSEVQLMETLADRLVQMYSHESDNNWKWFESYITYANAVIPEALLCAAVLTDSIVYKTVAQSTFDFLIEHTFTNEQITVITNKGWMHKGIVPELVKAGAEQPIDVAYTIIALRKFSQVFPQSGYYSKLVTAFSWFNGNNHLNQIVYNPCTGGCYDGLERNNINLNQGAESTISYLISRLVIEMAQAERHSQQKRASQFHGYSVPMSNL
jgi:glycosyltransferase involved in cell wall biosynthesis